jgi:hypothetical protein
VKSRAGWLAALGLLLALAPAVRAEPPAPPSASGAPERPNGDARVQRELERLKEHLRELPSAWPPPIDSAMAAGSAAPLGSGVVGRAMLEELARRWAERSATRAERRERHRAELLTEAGQHVTEPEVVAELKLHATRVADLARAEFLATNARSGADRDKLLARVSKLSLKEAARHRARMAKLLATPAAPSAAPAPRAVPAPGAAPPAPSGSSNGAAR